MCLRNGALCFHSQWHVLSCSFCKIDLFPDTYQQCITIKTLLTRHIIYGKTFSWSVFFVLFRDSEDHCTKDRKCHFLEEGQVGERWQQICGEGSRKKMSFLTKFTNRCHDKEWQFPFLAIQQLCVIQVRSAKFTITFTHSHRLVTFYLIVLLIIYTLCF